MADRDELRRLAEAATPWPEFFSSADRVYGEEEQFFVLCDGEARDVPVIHVTGGDADEPDIEALDRGERLAAYIARLDPQTVLGLLDENAALRERVERLRAALVAICETTCSWLEVEDIATRQLHVDDEAAR